MPIQSKAERMEQSRKALRGQMDEKEANNPSQPSSIKPMTISIIIGLIGAAILMIFVFVFVIYPSDSKTMHATPSPSSKQKPNVKPNAIPKTLHATPLPPAKPNPKPNATPKQDSPALHSTSLPDLYIIDRTHEAPYVHVHKTLKDCSHISWFVTDVVDEETYQGKSKKIEWAQPTEDFSQISDQLKKRGWFIVDPKNQLNIESYDELFPADSTGAVLNDIQLKPNDWFEKVQESFNRQSDHEFNLKMSACRRLRGETDRFHTDTALFGTRSAWPAIRLWLPDPNVEKVFVFVCEGIFYAVPPGFGIYFVSSGFPGVTQRRANNDWKLDNVGELGDYPQLIHSALFYGSDQSNQSDKSANAIVCEIDVDAE